jgi:hypothetical protein
MEIHIFEAWGPSQPTAKSHKWDWSRQLINILHVNVKVIKSERMQWIMFWTRSRDSVVGIPTGYGLDYRGVGVWAPVGPRIFSSLRRPDRLWVPPNLLSNGYRGLFPGGKVAGAWSSLTSSYCRGKKNVNPLLKSLISQSKFERVTGY